MSTASSSTQSIYNPRRHVGIHPERISNVSSTDYPGHYPDEDHSWNLTHFKNNLRVQVQRLSQRSIEFDLVGVDASIANAFRRILIAEVPTIAIEYVYVWNNTSVIVDEVLSHRLGLIPINIDPALMDWRPKAEDLATDRNTIVFKLLATCVRKPKTTALKAKDKPKPDDLYENYEITAGQLVWEPQGEQAEVFADNEPRPINENIVIAKLRPGQEIDMELHAIKGVGKDHAKWSPVATASYRILPLVILNPQNPVPPHLAKKFQSLFSPGVIKVDPVTKEVSVDEHCMRNEAMSREVFRHKEFDGCVELKRVRDFFIFNVESEGPYSPERLLPEAIKVMRDKLSVIRAAAEELLADFRGGGVGGGESSSGDVQMTDL